MEPSDTPLVKYSPAEAEIKTVAEEVTAALATVPPEAPERLDLLKTCHAKARDLRLAVEARRIELNEHPLELTRQINAKAKQLQALIAAVEEPIKRERKAIEDAREAAARAIVEAQERERKDKEEAERKAVQDKIDAERRQLADERAEMERNRQIAFQREQERMAEADRQVREQRQQLAAERAKLEEASRAVREAEERIAQAKRAEQEAKERAEWEALAKERAAAEAKALMERQAAENERRRKEEADEQAWIEASRPDVEKIRRFGKQIRDLAESAPELSSQALQFVVTDAHAQLMLLANTLEKLKAVKKVRKVAQPTP